MTEIMDAKRREIAPFARPVADEELAAFARRSLPAGFRASLEVPGRLTVIAEVKRASPSVGTIKGDVDAVDQARAYAEAGADCVWLGLPTAQDYVKAAAIVKKPLFAVIGGANFPATVEAMKAARRGELVTAGKPASLLASLNADG